MAEKQTPIPAVTPSPDMTRLLLIDAVSGYPLKRTKSGMRIAKSWDGATTFQNRRNGISGRSSFSPTPLRTANGITRKATEDTVHSEIRNSHSGQ